MKKLVAFYIFISLFLSISSYGQERSLTAQFENSFYRRFNPPIAFKDSCMTMTTFLQISINSEFKVSKIEFSKSAPMPCKLPQKQYNLKVEKSTKFKLYKNEEEQIYP